jgi:hypothetical protein
MPAACAKQFDVVADKLGEVLRLGERMVRISGFSGQEAGRSRLQHG